MDWDGQSLCTQSTQVLTHHSLSIKPMSRIGPVRRLFTEDGFDQLVKKEPLDVPSWDGLSDHNAHLLRMYTAVAVVAAECRAFRFYFDELVFPPDATGGYRAAAKLVWHNKKTLTVERWAEGAFLNHWWAFAMHEHPNVPALMKAIVRDRLAVTLTVASAGAHALRLGHSC